MATTRVLNKLESLIGISDLTNAELKFILTNWPDAARKLQAQVVRTFKDMDKIPAALQMLFIEMDERAARAIGELLCVEAQDLILSDSAFDADIPILVTKSVEFKAISEALWKRLAKMSKEGTLKAIIIKKLCARNDVHPGFLRAVGVSASAAVKEQVRASTKVTGPARSPRAAKPVSTGNKSVAAVRGVFKPKTKSVKVVEEDDDFADPKKVGTAVRRVRRPVV